MAIVFDGLAGLGDGAIEIVIGGSTPVQAAFFSAVADVGVSDTTPNHRFEGCVFG